MVNEDLEIVRDFDPQRVYWPVVTRGVGPSGSPINQWYESLRGVKWEDAQNALEAEERWLERLGDEDRPLTEEEEDDLALDQSQYLNGIDLGVAGAAFALSAAGCVTVTSCSGGPDHHEDHPLIVFGCKPAKAGALLEIAEQADCGLTNEHPGYAMLFARDVQSMMQFARLLIARRLRLR